MPLKTAVVTAQRFFVALPVPPHVVDRLVVVRERYPHFAEGYMPPEKLHLTLWWLDEDKDGSLIHALNSPLPQTFVPTIRLTHVGVGHKSTQLWAYAEPSNRLQAIREALLKRLPNDVQGTLTQSINEFVPHITLAKAKKPVTTPVADTPLSVSFTVSEATILGSVTGPAGSSYQTLGSIALADKPL